MEVFALVKIFETGMDGRRREICNIYIVAIKFQIIRKYVDNWVPLK